MEWLAIPVACGVTVTLAGTRCTERFLTAPVRSPSARPGVSVLKPLYGDEPMLEVALATLFQQAYPAMQIVFGVHSAADPAVAVVDRLRRRYPDVECELVVDPARHGANGKVSNLINMFPAARHDIIVVADSDVHATPDYLDRLVTALEQPGVGLASVPYAGLPANRTLAGLLASMQITHGFLPGAVLSRALGRQDCLGATMALRRQDLMRSGGFVALADHLADDQVLGRRVAALGLRIVLAQTMVLTTVPENRLLDVFRHELRWARTIRVLAPVGYAASVIQYPLAWALLAVVLSGGAQWSVALFGISWVLRAVAGIGVDRALARSGPLAFSCPVWLLPVRDVLSIIVMMASYGGRRVIWRGHGLEADTPAGPKPASSHSRNSTRDDEDPVPASSLFRWLRRWRRLSLSG